MKTLITALFVLSASVAYAGDAAKGEKAFRKCSGCHSIEEEGRNGAGPNLWNVMNRGIAANEDYKYSKALKAFAEENPMWTPELMDAWLTNSKKVVKRTKMNWKERKEANRANITAYLQTMGTPTE